MIIVLRYGGDNIKVMLVEVVVNLKNTCVKFVILVACMYGEPLCDEVGA